MLRSVPLERARLRRQSCSCIGATQGIKTMSAARRPRDRVRRAIWPRGVTRCVYNDRGAHAGIQMHTYTRIHMSVGFWILPRLSAYTCNNCQRYHVRAKECRRLCRPDISRPVGRFASTNSPCKITTERIRARSSRLPKRSSSRRPGITSDR